MSYKKTHKKLTFLVFIFANMLCNNDISIYKHYVNPHVVLTNNCVFFYTVLFDGFKVLKHLLYLYCKVDLSNAIFLFVFH